MTPQRPPLDTSAFRAVCEYAVAHIILPDDVMRVAAGLRPREPFLIEPSQLARSFRLGTRYLSILAALYRGGSARFNECAPKVRGRVRTYFARTREEIESTGHSNSAAEIPDSPWYASINNSEFRRSEIVRELMAHMGFSYDYTRMVSRLCLRRTAELPNAYVRALAKLPKA
jgi:hypothetical protein